MDKYKSLASTCGFDTELPTVMRDIFVIGFDSNAIKERLFDENASKADVTFSKIALAKESAIAEPEVRTMGTKSESMSLPEACAYYADRGRSSGDDAKPSRPSSSFRKSDRKPQPREESKEKAKHSKCAVCGR